MMNNRWRLDRGIDRRGRKVGFQVAMRGRFWVAAENHHRGSNWEAALRKAGLLDLENKELVSTLIQRITKAISLLGDELRAEHRESQ